MIVSQNQNRMCYYRCEIFPSNVQYHVYARKILNEFHSVRVNMIADDLCSNIPMLFLNYEFINLININNYLRSLRR